MADNPLLDYLPKEETASNPLMEYLPKDNPVEQPVSSNPLDVYLPKDTPVKNGFDLGDQVTRKVRLAEKTMFDIVGLAPKGKGAERVIGTYNKVAGATGLPKLTDDIKNEIVNIQPESPVEHAISFGSQMYGFNRLLAPINAVFGLGQGVNLAKMSLSQKVIRGAGVGGTIGAVPSLVQGDNPQDVAMNAGVGALTGGALTGGVSVLGSKLAQFENKRFENKLSITKQRANEINQAIDDATNVGMSNKDIYQTMLGKLNDREKNDVLNVLKVKYGQTPTEYRNFYQQHIADPAYNGLISKIEKITPDWLKESLVYKPGSPKQLEDLIDQKNTNIVRFSELAERSGNLMVEGVNPAESTIMLRALGEPLQAQLLKDTRPDLYSRVQQVRNSIDEVSHGLTDEMVRKASLSSSDIRSKNIDELRQTITDNIGSYVKRVYLEKEPEVKGVINKFIDFEKRKFRTIKEPKVYERAAAAKEIYNTEMKGRIVKAQKEYNSLASLKNVIKAEVDTTTAIGGYGSVPGKKLIGIGDTIERRLMDKGIKTTDDLANADVNDIVNSMLQRNVNTLDNNLKKSVGALNMIEKEMNNISNLYKKHGISGGASDVALTGGLTYEKFMQRTKPVQAQMKLEADLKSRYEALDKLRSQIKDELKQSASETIKQYETNAWQMKSMADSIRRKRVHLGDKIREYDNLMANPMKQPDIPYDIKKKLDIVETGGYPVYKTIRDAGYQLEQTRLLNDIASNYRLAGRTALKGWVKVPDVDSNGSLRGMYVHPEVAKELQPMEQSFSAANNLYRSLLAQWKKFHTAYNPATHGVNIMSNTALLNMSNVPLRRIPSLISASIDDVANNSPLYQRMKSVGLDLGSFKKSELEGLKNFYTKESFGFNTPTPMGGLLKKAGEPFKNFDRLSDLYSAEETVFKMAKIRHMLEQGFDERTAFNEAEKWLFNYSKLPKTIQAIRDNPLGIPFVSFMYKSAPRFIEGLVKNPLDVLKYPLLGYALEQVSRAKYGLDDNDLAILKKNKPFQFVLPFKDSEGNYRIYNMGSILPYTPVFDGDNVIKDLGVLSNPVVTTGVALVGFNKDPFSGKEIYDPNSDVMSRIKDSSKYILKQVLPPLTPYIGYAANNVGKSIQGIPLDKYGTKPDYALELLNNVGGIKTKPVNMSVQQYKLLKESQSILKEFSMDKSAIIKDQSLTEDERKLKLKELLKEFSYKQKAFSDEYKKNEVDISEVLNATTP